MFKSIAGKCTGGAVAALLAGGAPFAGNLTHAQGLPPETQILLDTFVDVVETNTTNQNIISFANRIVEICPQLTLQFDPDFDPTAPDFDPSLETASEVGGVQGDLVRRCTAAVEVANGAGGADPASVVGVLGQLVGDEVLGFDTAVSGIDRTQTQLVAGRVAAFTAGSAAARTIVAQQARPVIFASYQDTGTMSDASPAVSGAFADEAELGLGWSAYVNGYLSFGEQDPTELESGFEFDSYALSVGADRAIGERYMIGAALTVGQTDVSFDGNAGDTETMGISIAGYGAAMITENLSASLLASYGFLDLEASRVINYTDTRDVVNRVARGETEADQIELTGTADYFLQNGELSWGPTARVSYIRQETDGYEETGAEGLNLVYGDQESTSFTGAIGLAGYYAISTERGVLSPYARIEYEHEFDDDARAFSVRYVGDTFNAGVDGFGSLIRTNEPDRDRVRLGGGVATQFARGFSGFADYETVLGLSDVTAQSFSLGVRYEF